MQDPLFPSYIARALNSQLLSPRDVLASLPKALPNIADHWFPRYPVIRIITQAITVWKPSSPVSVNDVALVWNVERALHQFMSVEDYLMEEVLLFETLEAWKQFLTSPSVTLTLKQEKEKNPGASLPTRGSNSRTMEII